MLLFGASGGICSIQSCNNGSFCKSFSQLLQGYKVDSQIIFQPNIFKNALQMILRITDELQVCPRINDPTLLDYAERKELKLL